MDEASDVVFSCVPEKRTTALIPSISVLTSGTGKNGRKSE
jgi:hypothetical protein